ncbi:MAG: 2-hydroxychromene-2-carboxylate isomerase [Candidatus Andeanibacterium colombiense]|uniref:2-hydroxychromene-2-carboxylate isomerase n=1 Tax=Candidatus Andeanibacterium colombiense TaxID=3121345 RepID=A0AAJ5X5V6_9SPHN|nr:MAG: 2-hydroxychromene-2-carboxylate isomerase [Sphingomonadaceae bacterium]
MTQSIELFLEFRSPYTYLALTQLSAMDLDIALRPVDLHKVMKLVGNVPTSLTCEPKGRYARVDLERWATRSGVSFNPSNMSANDADACSRAVLAATTSDDALTVALTLFRALWSEAKTLANADDVVAALADADIDLATIKSRIDSPEMFEKYIANTNEAARRGVFGSPTIFVGDAMFFGNDRLDFVREELARLEMAA